MIKDHYLLNVMTIFSIYIISMRKINLDNSYVCIDFLKILMILKFLGRDNVCIHVFAIDSEFSSIR